ncbi:MAG: hypothetical protein OEN02_07840 [Gammaproteobacteria bacterium]|nr:hypothetical protein [Gammaproteobacteria bacterium]MDH3536333.1 hypothetical protein [Gammaproteobacteria bacterium]
MKRSKEILILGASYGSLLGAKLALAGHKVHLVCLPQEAEVINENGVLVRMPVRGRPEPVLIDSKTLAGEVTAGGPEAVDVDRFDLVALAMQEPQYRLDEIRSLLQRIGDAGKPCMSIMNMPPLPYLRRIPGLDCDALRECYVDASVWDALEPSLVTLCSPDPQAFRPPGEPLNLLQVALPTNFKAARFERDEHTELLRQLERDIVDARLNVDGEEIELPVKLRVHDSIFVPMAKWSMLLTGNYRCIQRDRLIAIRDAVHGDIAESKRIYDWVADLCITLGADRDDLVPFEKYAKAAEGLEKPSSAARALDSGAVFIERVDLLVKNVALQHGLRDSAIDQIVDDVEFRLERNRALKAS